LRVFVAQRQAQLEFQIIGHSVMPFRRDCRGVRRSRARLGRPSTSAGSNPTGLRSASSLSRHARAYLDTSVWCQERTGGNAAQSRRAQAVNGRTMASRALRASFGSSSICKPRCPPLRNTLDSLRAASSMAIGTRFFCAKGLMPPMR
jgi:hypothetical protein